MKRADLLFALISLILDIAVLVGTFVLVYFLRYKFGPTALSFGYKAPFNDYLRLLIYFIPVWIMVFAFHGLYQIRQTRSYLNELSRVFLAVATSVLITLAGFFLIREADYSRLIFFYFLIIAFVGVSFVRIILLLFRRYLYRFGIGQIRVVVIGKSGSGEKFKDEVIRNKKLGLLLVKYTENFEREKFTKYLKKPGIDEIVLANPFLPESKREEVFEFCNEEKIKFAFIPDLFDVQASHFDFNVLGSVPFVVLKRTPLEGWGRIAKRMVDLLFSTILLIIFIPLFLVIALLVKLTSKGPVFFRQERMGRSKTFSIFKFRSMVDHADEMKKKLLAKNERSGPLFKIKNDPRVTKLGKFLRRSRLDELPQLFNVFLGQMSLVGPRPHLPAEIANYEKRHREVLGMKPGITGMAQVSGASDISFDEEVKLDTFYIKNWTIIMDLSILVRTLWVVITRRGAA